MPTKKINSSDRTEINLVKDSDKHKLMKATPSLNENMFTANFSFFNLFWQNDCKIGYQIQKTGWGALILTFRAYYWSYDLQTFSQTYPWFLGIPQCLQNVLEAFWGHAEATFSSETTFTKTLFVRLRPSILVWNHKNRKKSLPACAFSLFELSRHQKPRKQRVPSFLTSNHVQKLGKQRVSAFWESKTKKTESFSILDLKSCTKTG